MRHDVSFLLAVQMKTQIKLGRFVIWGAAAFASLVREVIYFQR